MGNGWWREPPDRPPGWIETNPRYIAAMRALDQSIGSLERDDFKPFVSRCHHLWHRLLLGRAVDPLTGAFGEPGPTRSKEFFDELEALHAALAGRAEEVEGSDDGQAVKARLAEAAKWLRKAEALFPKEVGY